MPALKLSRYEFATPHTDEDGNTFLDVPDPISKRSDADDFRMTIGSGDTLHSLAWKLYKATLNKKRDVRAVNFYWVIAEFNDVVDATEDLPLGATFRAPSLARLVGEITVPPPFYSRNEVV